MGLVTLRLDSGDHICLGDLAVGGNFVFSLIIVAIFIGLGRAYRLGEDSEVTKWGASHKGMGPSLWGRLTPQDIM